ncbi:MAG: SDR family oxidoreductase [Anaerolineales bacterium]
MNSKNSKKSQKPILVTGATGYVGGRLVPRLLESGYSVRCLVRDKSRFRGHEWQNQVEVVEADVLDPATLPAALENISTAYYLIHGVQGGKVNPERDQTAARNFIEAAENANVERIIYLGELANPDEKLSPYLRSRLDTGEILRSGSIPTTEFRSGMIVGSGSALFEMVRYLSEREPVMICPRWFYTLAQPISIRKTLDYLVAALDVPESRGRVIEIGGPTRLRYADMLKEYAEVRDLKRLLIPAPVSAPRLSAYWVHLVTPIHWRVVLPLIQGLKAESLVTNSLAQELFPHIQLLDFQTAVRRALDVIRDGKVETIWSDSLVSSLGDLEPYRFSVEDGMMIERRQRLLEMPPEVVFKAYTGIGGERGWLYMDWAWAIRGWMDKLVGGVGLRRGRRDPDEIRAGESLDFWRVESITPNRAMLLRAEMRTPGKAWLEFESIPQPEGKTLLKLGAYFAARGLGGLLYWYSLFPIHKFIFDGMIRNLTKRAAEISQTSGNSHGE